MTTSQEQKLIEVLIDIVAAQAREMGIPWCTDKIDKLNAIFPKEDSPIKNDDN